MKYLVKDGTGRVVLATFIKQRAYERVEQNPQYKLIIIPEDR